MSNLDTIINQIDTRNPEKQDYNQEVNDNEFTTLMVQDILCTIVNDAFEYSDRRLQKQLVDLHETVWDDISSSFMNNMTSVSEEKYIDISKNYKEDFLEILQNLKCKTMKIPQANSDSSLEQQIQNIVNEIKQLETSIQESKISEKYLKTVQSVGSQTDYKLSSKNKSTNLLQLEEEQDIEDEVELQVIHHDDFESSAGSSSIPYVESMEEVSLKNVSNPELPILAQGDQLPTISSRSVLNTQGFLTQGGETDVEQPVPDPEPEEKLNHTDTLKPQKKKKLGTRLWRFITKTPASECNL